MLLTQPLPAQADDLEIFGGTLSSVKPNVLIVFDTSLSMASCVDSTRSCSAPNDRLSAAKNAVNQLLASSGQNARFGLMKFNPLGSNGGNIVRECGDLTTADVSALSANSSTPLSETLVEAGLYFAGENSWFNSNVTYSSPIQYSCQKNFIIVMTDGEPRDDFKANESDILNNAYINPNGDPIGDYDGDSANLANGEFTYVLNGQQYTYPYNGSDYLDDIAAYLYENDCNQNFDGIQNIKTFTIGFALNVGNLEFAANLLDSTAVNGGTQQVHSAADASSLASEFQNILSNIMTQSNAIYAAPAIPRKPDNQVEAGDKAYMAFFKPQSDGRWIGNLKAYGLENNTLMDSRSTVASPLTATDSDGLIKNTARSYWDVDNTDDGLEVAMGGVGEVLSQRIADNGVDNRNVYTFADVDAVNFLELASPQKKLSHLQNKFRATNVQGLDNLLVSIYNSATPPEVINADTLIGKVVNGTTYTFDDGTTTNWYLGDIVHSEPLVENFPVDCNGDGTAADDYIFVGANDGMLHTFCAATGQEMWAFIPPSQLGRLNLLGDGSHHYFVDGSPVMAEIKVPNTNPVEYQKVLVFGEGRGGQRYIALDFTASDNPTDPYWRYQVHENILNDADAVLGQAWAKPQFKTIHSGNDNYDVFLLTGGYDPRYENITFPASVPQSPEIQGRSIYTVNASTGNVVGLNLNGANWADMEHSIVDVTGFDAADNGYMDRVYAGDLGGNMLAAKYDPDNDIWEKLVLLALPDSLTFEDSLGNAINDSNGNPIVGTIGKKILTRPEVTLESDGECVYFGTGDREHLLDESVTDIFYVACHDWEKQVDSVTGQPKFENGQYVYAPVFPADTNNDGIVDASDVLNDALVDVTDNLLQDSADAATRVQVKSRLDNSPGWYLRMEHPGEKITSSPKLLEGKIYFTTFTPDQTSQNQDPCSTTHDLGTSRLYAIDYRTGVAAFDFDKSTTGLTKEDRSIEIGTSVAYEPVLATSGVKTTLLYGSGGKLKASDVSLKTILNQYYWRQIK